MSVDDQLLLQLIRAMKEQNRDEFARIIDELQPYDMAVLYSQLPAKHHPRLLQYMSSKDIASLIQELEQAEQLDILRKLDPGKLSDVMDLMENDDLADLLGELPAAESAGLLSVMNQEEKQTVQNLMQYPRETAGGMMTNRYVWIRKHFTVREAIDKLKVFADLAENLYYLYVIDESRKLVGVVSYRDLLLADIDDLIDNVMYSRVIAAHVSMDQEEVARIIERYDFISLPVVDDDGKLVGIVTVDDVIDVFIREADEDIGKLSASGKSIDLRTGALTASRLRLPWLVLLLFLGLLSGSIISRFEDTLQQVVALTFFMPMIAGMTGNTGTQSLAVVVRGLASGDADKRTIVTLLKRELLVGLIIGTICGLLIGVIAQIWQGSMALGLVVGISLFLTLIIGTMAGTVIPIVLYRLKVDPAVASGPLITTLNDTFSLLVYFGTATWFLSYL
jgi:magnesium transporter